LARSRSRLFFGFERAMDKQEETACTSSQELETTQASVALQASSSLILSTPLFLIFLWIWNNNYDYMGFLFGYNN
jgi:hypothetical protein